MAGWVGDGQLRRNVVSYVSSQKLKSVREADVLDFSQPPCHGDRKDRMGGACRLFLYTALGPAPGRGATAPGFYASRASTFTPPQ